MFKKDGFQFVTADEISSAAAAELLNQPRMAGCIPTVRRVGAGYGRACRLPKALVALDPEGLFIVVRDRDVTHEILNRRVVEIPPATV